MIPLRDNIPSQRPPHVTYFLVTVNVVVFTYEVLLGLYARSPQFAEFLYTWGAVPSNITRLLFHPAYWGSNAQILLTPFSSMFIHGGFMHLAGNMLFLYIFGDNVEDELGHVAFLLFYLVTGLAGAATHILLDPSSTSPMVGASGAISGIMGAYFLLHPKARVMTLVIFILITVIEIPAYWFLGFWFLLQFMGGLNSLGGGGMGGVAFWAHVGGFAAGWLLIRIWVRRFGRRYIWWGG